MKKMILLLACVLAMAKAYAVPAYPFPVHHVQPDGTTIVIVAHGDEFFHFTTTADGYTIVKNEQGFYTYAQLQNGALVATKQLAHNKGERTADEQAFLATIDKNIHEASAESAAKKARKNVATKESASFYKSFKGLVVLVQFNDKKFMRTDAQAFYSHMFNDNNYAGYTNENGSTNYYGSLFIGGVRDYFRTNSNGIFAPEFDVAGPITVDMSCKDVNSTSNARPLFSDALDQLEASGFDFSQYDADNDGYIDMIYFIAAGYGANYSGNSSSYLWPHKSSLAYYSSKTYDGKRPGTYASSVEIYGWESQGSKVLDGIGTICHEFSHSIGLPDLYDTDYSTNGQSTDPGSWDVMAGGSYNSYGRRPVGYSAYERYAMGFNTAKKINKAGTYTLNELQSAGDILILPSANADEFFIFENRQRTSWDESLPGHGMLVARVDSSDASIWYSNKVNAYSNRNYYEILRAGGTANAGTGADTYPGTNNVTELNNFTSPALTTWDKHFSDFVITGITENDGVISFTVLDGTETFEEKIEDFESIGATATGATGVTGRFCNWDFTKAAVTAITSSSKGNGSYSLAMTKPSAITTSDCLSFNPLFAAVSIFNTTSTDAKFKMQYMEEGSTEWVDASPADVTVAAKTSTVASFTLGSTKPCKYRLYQYGGSTTAKVYVDDIIFSLLKTTETLLGDVNGDGKVSVDDVSAIVNKILNGETSDTATCDINGDGKVDVNDISSLVNIIINASNE